MEVSLPIFARNSQTNESRDGSQRGSAHPDTAGVSASSIRLPLIFILTGLVALCAGIAWLFVQPSVLASYHYNQYVVSLTHLFVLGWICSIVMGAMYQLVPVALETKLYSEKLAWWQFVFHTVGFAGMVWMFRIWNMKQVGHFGCVLAVGVGLFVYNIARTLRRVPRWNVTATAVTTALAWISVAIIAGLLVATAKCTYNTETPIPATGPIGSLIHGLRSAAGFMSHFNSISAMHAHAHLGALGFFTILIVGVSYKLIPMFTLSEVQSRRRASFSIAFLNAGLVGSFVTILVGSAWKSAFACIVVAGLAIYAVELRAIFRARKRRTVDWGIKYFLTALVVLLPLSLLAVILSWHALPFNSFTGQLENLYGFLGFIGLISFAIIGMLYKIVPFLVWFGRYSEHIGRAKVPALADLYSARLQGAGYWTWITGLAVASTGIILSNETGVRIGCGLLAFSIATLMVNVATMLSHFFRPRIAPLLPAPILTRPTVAPGGSVEATTVSSFSNASLATRS
jgi:Cytochrome C and Quinol oxidase polypeptide I